MSGGVYVQGYHGNMATDLADGMHSFYKICYARHHIKISKRHNGY